MKIKKLLTLEETFKIEIRPKEVEKPYYISEPGFLYQTRKKINFTTVLVTILRPTHSENSQVSKSQQIENCDALIYLVTQ